MEIEDYCQQAPGQSTVAIFTLYIPPARMRIRKVRLVRLKSGHMKIALPSYSEIPKDQLFPGQKQSFKSYIEFSIEKQKELEEKTLQALQPFLKSK